MGDVKGRERGGVGKWKIIEVEERIEEWEEKKM